MPKLATDCERKTGATGTLTFNTRRVFYSLTQPNPDVPGESLWAQSTKRTALLVAENDGNDPASAVVVLHHMACVRRAVGGPPGTQPGEPLASAAIVAPLVTQFPDGFFPPPGNLACDQFTVGRGCASPQYRVEFRDGTNDGTVVYLDGSSVLSLPASQVKVELLTPEEGFILNPDANTPPTDNAGLFVDSLASASVSWSNRDGANGSPIGRATYTQTALVSRPPEGGAAANLFFERPPFAKKASIVWGDGFLAAAAPDGRATWRVGGTQDIGAVPVGFISAPPMMGITFEALIPGPATHMQINPGVSVPVGTPVSVVWLIGND